ncbi:MAG: amidohydrolase family protein [Acidobacteria bacterium]|nr:amidohydrolase family protein [Acidobacteriota bacterium]
MIKRLLFFCLLILSGLTFLSAETKKSGVIVIQGATVVTVTGDPIPGGTIVIEGDRIAAVGKDIPVPAGAVVLDATGLFAYPGMIDAGCFLGLQEIRMVRATVDSQETGRVNPQVSALEALRPDSMHIPISLSTGITAALVLPSGGLISGKCGLIKLTGWTTEEMTIKDPVAMVVQFPSMRGSRRPSDTPQPPSRNLQDLQEIFDQARYYGQAVSTAAADKALPLPDFNETLQFMQPVVSGELPVLFNVHSEKDILDCIDFVKKEKIKAVFMGVTLGWKAADKIAEAGIPVILGSMTDMPSSWDDGYDAVYRNPVLLHEAGVKIAFSSQSSSLAKDLPSMAGKAAAFGLDRSEALKAVTINSAEILGVAESMGSLEKGKLANIVLCDDDILELRTNIRHVFVEGVEADLSTVYTELLNKWKKRHKKPE